MQLSGLTVVVPHPEARNCLLVSEQLPATSKDRRGVGLHMSFNHHYRWASLHHTPRSMTNRLCSSLLAHECL